MYTFAGEIPWCTTFPDRGPVEFKFVVGEECVKIQRVKSILFLDGKQLDMSFLEVELWRHFGMTPPSEEGNALNAEELERVEAREILADVEEQQQIYDVFEVLLTASDFGWESYHSNVNDAGSALTLAKEIACDMALIPQPQTFDLYTKQGQRATIGVADRRGGFTRSQDAMFIRADLLEAYLEKRQLSLIWAFWGERQPSLNKQSHAYGSVARPVVFQEVIRHPLDTPS